MFKLNSEQTDYLESLLNFKRPLIPGVKLSKSQLEAISNHPKAAYYFAKEVVKGKWDQGEKAISKDPRLSYYYALVCLRQPFELGRYTIEQSYQYKFRYARLLKAWSERA
jgi:hypothetical protein